MPRPLRAIPDTLQPAPPSAAPQKESFQTHLEDAIRLNRSRRDVYDRLSAGRSRSLSTLLISLELLSLPAAMLMDRWAKPFQDSGIGIIHQDFVSMKGVKSPFAPPRWRGVATDSDAAQVKAWLSDYRQAIGKALDRTDFPTIARASHDLLERLEETEARTRSHFAMSKHLVESLGLAALNASAYSAQSKGETERLSRTFIRLQSLALISAVAIDRQAQELHRQGIGILVNDVPEIPFVKRFEEQN